MSNESDMKSFVRGGQIFLHNLRMLNQVVKKVGLLCLVILTITCVVYTYYHTTKYQFYLCKEFFIAKFNVAIKYTAKQIFINPNGVTSSVFSHDVIHATFIKNALLELTKTIIEGIILGLAFQSLAFAFVYYWLKNKGKQQSENIIIKGDSILTSEQTTQLIKSKKEDSDLVLGGLPLIKGTETAHLFFHGTTGTGKSNAIKELLDQLRKRGDRAIIYDKSCNFLEEFYQPTHDVILNPLDERGRQWDLWKECRDSADFDSLAAAQIPMPTTAQDPFWVNAARTIFSTAAFEMRNDENRSTIKLLQYLLTADLAMIQKYLKGTEAEVLVSEKGEKTAISIKSVLATYLKSLKYVRDGQNAFSIRQWIQNEKANNWLFITSLGDRHETLKPLITSWMDIAVNALLSLNPNPNRRIWLILDELTSLQQLPYLTQMLSEARKFGGSTVIGIQNYAQLAKTYGQDGARDISSLLNTRFMFRQPDPEVAKWSALNFGESVIDEVREGISYGANSIRDGISINRAEQRKQVISYSEIMSLPNLHAYVRLPGQFPVTRVKFSYQERLKNNIGIVNRQIDENQMKEVDGLIENLGKKFIDDSPTNKPSKKAKKSKLIEETEKFTDFLDV